VTRKDMVARGLLGNEISGFLSVKVISPVGFDWIGDRKQSDL
jgi:hypothetical protein